MKILNLIALCTCLAFGGEFDLNAANGAVTNLTPLKKAGQIELKLNNSNPVTGLDYDEESKSFLVGTLKFELYSMDENLDQIKSYLRSTPDWIIQMEDTVGASFFKGSLGLISYNKTYEFFKARMMQIRRGDICMMAMINLVLILRTDTTQFAQNSSISSLGITLTSMANFL